MKNFFISYNRADRRWAVWIAWTLEAAGYSTVIQDWDFRPGDNFVLEMHRAIQSTERTILVLSESFLDSSFTAAEWSSVFAADPDAQANRLIPVKVLPCRPEGLLKALVEIDLVGLSAPEAKAALLRGLEARGKPAQEPGFPGIAAPVFPAQADFPEKQDSASPRIVVPASEPVAVVVTPR